MMEEVKGTKSIGGASKPDIGHNKERAPPRGSDLEGKTWRITEITKDYFSYTRV